jgi:hypothetical protein
MSYALLQVLLHLTSAHAADKIGNGGGIWICWTATGEIEAATQVDLYEAVAQYDRVPVPPVHQDPLQIADDVTASIRARFPDYATTWIRELENVKARRHAYGGELKEINDSHYIGFPNRNACHGKPWDYVQFANYDDVQEIIQIRSDLWDSPKIAALDKAALLWHEAIYRWMRDEFGDDTSTRARQIVGILFSGLDAARARQALDTVLKPAPPTDPNAPTFVCLTRNGINNRYFLDYGPNELAAKNQTVKTCRDADPQYSFHCDEQGVRCESFTNQRPKFTCAVRNGISNQTYTEMGRSPLEAEGKARRACSDANFGLAVHCAEPVCN